MENIYAIMIFEIMGRPAEYIKETLSQLVDKIQSEKGCSIVDKKVFEPKSVEQHQGIFTTFAEVEMTFERIEQLLKVVFTYLPSHVDIVKPQQSALTNIEMNYLVNELASTLHRYDEVAKRMMLENDTLKRMMEQKAAEPLVEKNERFVKTENIEERKLMKKRSRKKKEKVVDPVSTIESIEEKKEETAHVRKNEKGERMVKEKADFLGKEKEEKIEDKDEVGRVGEDQEPVAEEKADDGKEGGKEKTADDPDGLYKEEMTLEEEEYLDDLDDVLDEDEEKS